jgi:UrcA family protein
MNTIKTINFRRLIAGAAFSVLLGSFAAAGYAADGIPQETVKYGDLNVSSSQGAAALYARIRAAAHDVCQDLDRRGAAAQMTFKACVNKAISGAVHDVDQPALTAFYNSKNGSSKPIILASGATH